MDLGSDSNASPVSVDKSSVLEVKPLRRLVPVFPNPQSMSSILTPHPTPFLCVPPSGPFPSGVQPFYPFMIQNDSQHTTAAQNQPTNFGFSGDIPAPVPLNSFRTPSPRANGKVGRPKKAKANAKSAYKTRGSGGGVEDDSSGESEQYAMGGDNTGNSGKRVRGPPKTRSLENSEDVANEALVNGFLTVFKLKEFDDFQRSIGDKDTVRTVLLVFDLLRRRLVQLEEAKDHTHGGARRPDLKAATLLMTKGIRANSLKRIGHVPGVDVGDIFFFRMELCVVGLHAPSMAGIDYMSVKVTMDEEPLAVSIVSSGGYDDQGDDSNVIIYSGQGGVQRRDGQMFDQKLERGNLALEKSLHRANDVRVIRGIKDVATNGKIYVYDGIYQIQESWVEKNKSGCNVFKYKLVRIPGQPEAFSVWKSIQQWTDGTANRPGIILPDLTSGAESQPVALVNDVDGEKGPAHFTYISNLKYSQPFPASQSSVACRCLGGCQPGDTHCPCNQKNDGYLPYSPTGVLLSNKPLIHECGMNCECPPTCRSRLSQSGIKARLEVFKTRERGWGLRSWDPIRGGGYICEYAGDIIKTSNAVEYAIENDDDYIFDATRHYEPLQPVDDSTAKPTSPFPLVISAKNNGNVARFMNHSCSPNVYWKPVLRENENDVYLHIVFFAIRHIPPMQELTFDYGIVPSEKGKKTCSCGSVKCRGHFH